MPKKDVIKLKSKVEKDQPGFEVEYVTMGFLRSVMTLGKPYGKFMSNDGGFIFVISNTDGKADLESFYVGQEKKAEEWLKKHD